MQQGPRVVVIGLDCGTPKLLFDDLHAEVPDHRQADGRGDVRRPRVDHPADHRAGLGLRDDRRDAGPARALRLPQPQGHDLRRPVDRALGLDQGARRLGRARRPGQAFGADRRAAVVPAAQGVPGLARRLLPHPALGRALGLPAGARGRDRGGARRQGRVHLRHPELPPGRLRRDARPGLQDDRATVPGRPAADPEQAVGLLHALRHRARPAAPRVLAVLRQAPPALRGREQVRDGLPGLLPVPGPAAGGLPRARPGRRRHDRDERPRRAADDGRPVLQRLADPGGLPDLERARHERADPDQGRRDRLEPHRRLGRRRLLRAPVPERQGPRAAGHGRARQLRGDARRADREARGRARSRRRAARHEGAQAAGRLPRGARRRARPDRVLRRPRVALGRLGRQPEPLHVRERHRPRRREPRPRRHLHHEGAARAADGQGRRAAARRRGPDRSCPSTASTRPQALPTAVGRSFLQ